MELRFRVGSRSVEMVVGEHDGRTTVTIDGRELVLDEVSFDDRSVTLSIDGVRRRVLVDSERGHVHAAIGGHSYEFVPGEEATADQDSGRFTPEISSPMPGKVLAVLVGPGDIVEPDAALLLLEAMKMETTVRATHKACVVEVRVVAGVMVGPGDVLLRLEEALD
ncbi:MAG: hypothetical protein HY899_12960 [Deltaproteobacteria bacterium]|nr:hypothetical protein [Deltaproteobacteria bacterium]